MLITEPLTRLRVSKVLIIAITGMPGAGKSTVAGALGGVGLRRIAMGDMIREETSRRGLPLDDKNMGAVMQELRGKYGAGAVAELCLLSIQSKEGEAAVVIDGIRSVAEIEIFRKAGDVKLLAVLASPKRRFELLTSRGRADAPPNLESFKTRDARELSIGIGGAIALADEAIVNEHITPDELADAALSTATRWMRPVGS
jgi:dephospho-CoA kinase